MTWLQLHHPSLSKRPTVCTKQDLGTEHSILQYVAVTLDVYQVCHSVGRGVVPMKHRSESQWTVMLGYLTISKNIKCYYRVVYNNFVFQFLRNTCAKKYQNPFMCV